MNNKTFITELSQRVGYTQDDAQQMVNSLIGIMTSELQQGNEINVPSFGLFEVKKRMERIIVNPTTQQKMLVPPKLVLGYKPSTVLKSLVNE